MSIGEIDDEDDGLESSIFISLLEAGAESEEEDCMACNRVLL